MMAALGASDATAVWTIGSSEAAFAAMRAREGDAVVARPGGHWRCSYPGFYEPVHLLARLPAAEVRPPTRFCWGYRAALRAEDAHLANAALPVHVLEDVERFDESRISRNRRGDLRRCARLVELVRLETPELLLEEGHAVFMSAAERLGHWQALSVAAYREEVRRRTEHGRRRFVAGLVDGRLRGYLDSYVVDGVLYTDQIFVASDALRTGIGTGLYIEAIRSAVREGGIRTVCNGLHRPEDPGLCHYKQTLGFRVAALAARAVIAAPFRAYLRARRPATYYRLTGDASVWQNGGTDTGERD